mgnify:CR=1 FL=1
MADKKGLGIFKPTEGGEPEQAPEPTSPRRGRKKQRVYEPGEVAPIGVGLTYAEGQRLTEMARELGVNRHELLKWVLRDFMRRWDDGYRPETGAKTVKYLK